MSKNIIIFDLVNGKTIISEYETHKNTIFKLTNPILLLSVQDKQGRRGYQLVEYIGNCMLNMSGIVAMNLDSIDKTVMNQYIKVTTGIEIASTNILSS